MSGPVPPVNPAPIMAATIIILPKRGGVHPIYGAYSGGGEVGHDGVLLNPIAFHFVTQVRSTCLG